MGSSDFNGDGFDDLAAGVPNERVGAMGGAGAVNVLFGSAGGLTAAGAQLWHQASPGVPGAAEAGDRFGEALAAGGAEEADRFGEALAAGDFNGDGFGDLAVGVPGEDVGAINLAGAANVLFGSAGGLTAAGAQLWHQASPGVPGAAEAFNQFGNALAAGDFDGDGFDDLAAGVPGEDVGDLFAAGAANVLFGSAGGLTAAGAQIWHQGSPGVPGVAEENDLFGHVLAVGDFDGDGFDDLAAGVPLESFGSSFEAGAVNVLFGSAGGLTAASAQLWHQASPGVPGAAEAGDRFGFALAAGDFDGDGFDDLAVGAPFEEVGGSLEAGAVNVFLGSAGGLTAAGAQIWHQASPGVPSAAEARDQFGEALAAGDFNGDGFDDLAVGVHFEDVGAIGGAGAVNVFFGSAGGLTAAGAQLWHQASPGVPSAAEASGQFGEALAAGDFNGDGFGDLAVGVPSEDVAAINLAGAANVLFGSAAGLTAAGAQIWHQGSPGVPGVAEALDRFGDALA